MPGNVPPNSFIVGPLYLPGATATTRYVGGTVSGAPTSGTFSVGDYVIDETGSVRVCTVAGTPGTWVRYSVFKNVLDYGADPTGVADSTAAINSAIAALPAAGGTLLFPAGTYKSSGGHTIASNCTIAGEGSANINDAAAGNVSLIECTSATASLFTVTGDTVIFEKIALKNVSGAATAGAGITVNGTHEWQRVDYRNILIASFWINLDVQTGSHWTLFASTIYDPKKYGIRINNTVHTDEGDFAITTCWIQSAPGSVAADAAIRIEGGGGGRLTTVRINGAFTTGGGFVRGIDLAVGPGVVTGELFLTSVQIDGYSYSGFRFTFQDGTGQWVKVGLNGCFISPMNTTATGPAVELTGYPGGSYANSVEIVGCMFESYVAAPGPAIVCSRAQNVSVGPNLLVGGGFNSLVSQTGSIGVVDGSGSIANSVQITGTPTLGGVPAATGSTGAAWAFPAWLAWATYAQTSSRTPNVWGYYRFDESSGTVANDLSGNANAGTYQNAPTLGVAGALAGDSDTAITLNGTSQRVLVNHAPPSDPVSLSIWAKRSSTGAAMALFSASSNGWLFQFTATGTLSFEKENAVVLLATTATYTDTNWHHYCATKDALGNVAIYVDGVAAATGVTIFTIASNPNFYIGMRTSASDRFFAGSLDEAAVYSRALSAAEVNMLYRVGCGS